MNNDNLDRTLRLALGDAAATPAAGAAMDAALGAIRREAAVRPAARRTERPASAFSRAPRWAQVAAVGAAVCLCCGGTAYAADKLGLINLQPSGTYQTLMAVDAESAAAAAEPVADYRLELTYLPAGAVETDRDDHLADYRWGDYEKSLSSALFYLDSSDPLAVSDTTGSRAIEVNGREAIVFERQSATWEQGSSYDLYLVFPDERRVLWLWSDSLTESELISIAEGASLVANGKTVIPGTFQGEGREGDYLMTWSEEVARSNAPGEEGEAEPLMLATSTDEMAGLHAVGEAFPVACYAEQTWGDLEGAGDVLSAKVASVEVADSLDGLNPERMAADWADLEGENGLTAGIHYVAFGDGRTTTTSLVAEETVPVKIVTATVEYTNIGSEPLDDVLVQASLLRAAEENGTWSVLNREDAVEGAEDAQCKPWNVTSGEMAYYEVDAAHAADKNYIAHLEPGETATVTLAWPVPEDELDKLLLDLTGEGSHYQFTEAALTRGYVDIRQ
ncbi:hypothetical protein [uncultured Adlercreutzia sp.]|uniref:hypothetical protein n=1 Tax=uncultured Adlercreutzia sp. TaxID=875803 RepID=UPI0026F39FCF|nr:hypothetical protein [uncultured Adlercreutzia sp.]